MAHRKLVQQGNSTLMVSLPAQWIKEHKLQKGSTITIEQTPSGLLIKSSATVVKTRISISLKTSSETSLRMLLTNLYRRGYDTIELTSTTNIPIQHITKIIKENFIGFDIASSSSKHCLIENITEPDATQFENIIQKIFFNTKLLLTTTIARINKESNIESYLEIEERLRKYDNFARRVLSKRMVQTENIEYIWTFLSLFNHAQRQLYHLNKAMDNKYSFTTKTIPICQSILLLIEKIQKAYTTKSLPLIEEIHTHEKEIIYHQGYTNLVNSKGQDAIALYHLLCTARLLYQTTSPLGAIVLDEEISLDH